MVIELGILLALVAMIGWGFGDFFIQKSVRKIGDWESLFLVTAVGAIVLAPFIYKDFPALFSAHNPSLYILLAGSFILFIAAILNFEALKEGKISVVEPLWSLEIPVAALLAFFVMNESVGWTQIVLIIVLIAGLVMTSLRSYHLEKRIWLEKAVFLAIGAALIMGAANFFVGWGARSTTGLMMIWFINIFIAIACLFYIIPKISRRKFIKNIRENKGILAGMCIFDNIAWVAFAYSMTLAPIAITVALSESYIIISVLLGMFVNKEFLHKHQKIGLLIAIVAAVTLATIT